MMTYPEFEPRSIRDLCQSAGADDAPPDALDNLIHALDDHRQSERDKSRDDLMAEIAAAAMAESDDAAVRRLAAISPEMWPQAAPRPLDGHDLPDDPPPRDWLIPGWIPAGRLASLYGHGGTGKSRLAMQIAAALMHGGYPIRPSGDLADVADRPGIMREIRDGGGKRVLWLSWEDETSEFVRRWKLAHAAEAIRAEHPAEGGLFRYVDMRKIGGALWEPRPDGSRHTSTQGDWTRVGRDFLATLEGHDLAIVDPLAAAYASSEVERALVRQFCAALDGMAERAGCGVLLIGHPPKAGADGYSGSTDWRAAVRSMMVMERVAVNLDSEALEDAGKQSDEKRPDLERVEDVPRLRLDKASYAREGDIVWLGSVSRKATADAPGALAWTAETRQKATIIEGDRKGRDIRKNQKCPQGVAR